MSMIRFVGDIHGNYMPYLNAIDGVEKSVQVGDFGLGFGTKGDAEFVDSVIIDPMPGNHRFIRGNHDSPEECKLSRHWIPDGTFEDGIFYLGGAASIDQMYRTEGVSWWRDEELSDSELELIVEKWADLKPKILVAHETSEQFARNHMMPAVNSTLNFMSRTRLAIDRMYAAHRPETHIFGHWHHSVDMYDEYNWVRMICLGINEWKDIQID